MKIIFSRKGFDTSFGGAPSPIIDGRPVSLPIPGSKGETTRYADIGLGSLVHRATKGRLGETDACHDDPMFANGYCWLGQVNAAQGHLQNQKAQEGDVFLFFGLFSNSISGERHHRIFGSMIIAGFGDPEAVQRHHLWQKPPRDHPHFAGHWPRNNTIYFGQGATAKSAPDSLRLTREGGPLNMWRVPEWLSDHGLSYHSNPARWISKTQLDSAKRGQEFVCNIGEAAEPRRWLESILAAIAA